MRSTVALIKAVRKAGVLIAAAGCFCWGQYSPTVGAPQRTQAGRQQDGFGNGTDSDPFTVDKRLRALNSERHKSMVSDAEKLVKLAKQLDAEIASNPTGELTAEELHKVATIEKLAHNVKTKMAQSFGGGPELRPPISPIGGPGVD